MSFRHVSLHLNFFLALLYSVYTTQALTCYKCSDFVKGPCFHPVSENVLTETCTITDVPTGEENEEHEVFHCFSRRLYYHERGPVIYRGCVDDSQFCERKKRRKHPLVNEEEEAEDFNECEICEKDYCNSVPHKKIAENIFTCFFAATVLINFV